MENLLEQGEIASGDLFHRLNAFSARMCHFTCVNELEDIQPLTEGFLQEISTQLKISMPHIYEADF